MRGLTVLSPHGAWVPEAILTLASVTRLSASAVLPQIRVETQIGSQAKYEITN